MKTLLAIAAIQCGAVAAGYMLGGRVDGPRPLGPSVQVFTLLIPVVLAFEFINPLSRPESLRRRRRLAVAVLVYLVLLVVIELFEGGLSAFIFVLGPPKLYEAVAWLTPALAVVGPLVRARAWWAVAGTALLIFEFVTLMTYNASDLGSEVGFVCRILY